VRVKLQQLQGLIRKSQGIWIFPDLISNGKKNMDQVHGVVERRRDWVHGGAARARTRGLAAVGSHKIYIFTASIPTFDSRYRR
jgi:hypothetical protein